MPIYEYECAACGRRYEVFVRTATGAENGVCPACGSPETRRLLSTFAVTTARPQECGAAAAPCPDDAPCHEHCPWER